MPEPNEKSWREKYFSEMNDQEKVVKLSEELTRTQLHLAHCSHLIRSLMKHKHVDGEIVKKVEEYGDHYDGFHVYDFKK